MRNVILEDQTFMEFRYWLRNQQFTYKDNGRAVFVPSWKEYIVSDKICHGNKPAPQLAYEVLKKHYPNLRLRWRREELDLLEWKAPQKFGGEFFGELYYLDVKSAFAQFYQYLYLHSDWPFKAQKYPLFDVANDLIDYKLARNSVVGICRSVRDKWVSKGEVSYKDKINPFLSPTLWGQLAGILNQIALEMDKIGAIWINTDGYLFRKEEHYHKAIQYFLDREIVIRHGCGKGYILALTNIYVGGVKEVSSRDQGGKLFSRLQDSNVDFMSYWRKNRERISNS